MASRYSQEYFFQHSLMNIPFTDLNEIIHPNAESIPEYIRHFASAMFVNESFWNNPNAVTEQLEMEANTNDYISTYLSYINMLQATYKLVTKGKYSSCFSFSRLPYSMFYIFEPPLLQRVCTYQNVIITHSLLIVTYIYKAVNQNSSCKILKSCPIKTYNTLHI